MTDTPKPPAPKARSDDSDDSDDTLQYSNRTKSKRELKLWPPRMAQEYCRDHFLMEVEIYYEQENEKYRKLVAHCRKKFLAKQEEHCNVPQRTTRRQPSRRAKSKLASSGTRPTTSSKIQNLQIAPFRPAKIEKAFQDSPEGKMVQLLTMCHKKYSFHHTWKQYRSNIAGSIDEVVEELQETMKERTEPELCLFEGPVSAQCRYCEDDSASRPGKKMTSREKRKATHIREEWIDLSGMRVIVDICENDTKILVVHFKGLLDSCAELFDELDLPMKNPI
ncbi:hypothetical protein GGR57DRAFT_516482 [Xylariaceae sp. FL1272]|nr:hypothetical protein GGR57DRAFT_516482 [Xylariaceae sp. FL1272]